MTLNTSQPADQAVVSSIPGYIREDRIEINSLAVGTAISQTDLTVGAGETSLTVGTDLSTAGFESVVVTGGGAAALETILGGTDGQVKVLIFQDGNVDLVDGNSKADGKFFLNHLPAATNFAAALDDIIALRNIGGDGAAAYGYWKELYRTISVK